MTANITKISDKNTRVLGIVKHNIKKTIYFLKLLFECRDMIFISYLSFTISLNYLAVWISQSGGKVGSLISKLLITQFAVHEYNMHRKFLYQLGGMILTQEILQLLSLLKKDRNPVAIRDIRKFNVKIKVKST